MKLGGGNAPSPAASTPAPAAPIDLGGDVPQGTPEGPAPAPQGGSQEKPFDDKGFDAGIDVDEDSDPKKFIEKLSGKLGQSLRKYTETSGNPDFELEKFVVNSALAATHTSQMDPKDQDDIIAKVKEAGQGGDEPKGENKDTSFGGAGIEGADEVIDDIEAKVDAKEEGEEDFDFGADLKENQIEDEGFMLDKPKKLSIFAPEGSEESKFKHSIKERLKESFNQPDMKTVEPTIKPQPTTKPQVAPVTKPSRRNRPFLPVDPGTTPKPKASKLTGNVDEVSGKGKNLMFDVYHSTYSSAVQEAAKYAQAKGYEVDEQSWFTQITTGPKKPSEGQTNKASIELTQNGVPSKLMLHIQVFGMKTQYELNCYVA